MTQYQSGQKVQVEGLDGITEWVPVGSWESVPPEWQTCPIPCPPMCDRCDRGKVETLVAHLDTRSFPLTFLRDGDRMFLVDGKRRYDAAIRRKDGQVLAFVVDATNQDHGGEPIAMSGNQKKEMHRQRQDRRIRELEQEVTNQQLRIDVLEDVPKNLTTFLDEHHSWPLSSVLRTLLREWLGTWYDTNAQPKTEFSDELKQAMVDARRFAKGNENQILLAVACDYETYDYEPSLEARGILHDRLA